MNYNQKYEEYYSFKSSKLLTLSQELLNCKKKVSKDISVHRKEVYETVKN